jgi:hypothetical protein
MTPDGLFDMIPPPGLDRTLLKVFFVGTFLEPQRNADKRGFHGFLISVHQRPSAVPFWLRLRPLQDLRDLRAIGCPPITLKTQRDANEEP